MTPLTPQSDAFSDASATEAAPTRGRLRGLMLPGSSHRIRRAGVAAAVCLALGAGVVSCATDGSDSANSAVSMKSGNKGASAASNGASSDSAAQGKPSVPLDAEESPNGDFSMSPAEAKSKPNSYLGIEDVRIGSHGDFDRIVFEFTGEGSPGYFIRYEDIPVQQGSGKPISVSGAQKLAIQLTGMGYPFDFNMEDYPSGPVRPTDTDAIQEVVGAGTFEGATQYVAGLKKDRRPFKAFVLQNPTRLVIDIQTK